MGDANYCGNLMSFQVYPPRRKTDFAISNPTILICSIALLLVQKLQHTLHTSTADNLKREIGPVWCLLIFQNLAVRRLRKENDTTVAQFGYDRHEPEGYLENVRQNGSMGLNSFR
jgi:hypothetical protein